MTHLRVRDLRTGRHVGAGVYIVDGDDEDGIVVCGPIGTEAAARAFAEGLSAREGKTLRLVLVADIPQG